MVFVFLKCGYIVRPVRNLYVLNPDGTPIDSYCGVNSALYKGDGTDAMMKWSKGAISVLPEVPFRLRISMEKAEIYALEFVENKRK